MIKALAADHELIASELVAGIKSAGEMGDPATEDMFTERLRIHQKYAWMLRAMVDE
jgi:starvation-inducible DNA-binding protein